jgi:hypothetical protein
MTRLIVGSKAYIDDRLKFSKELSHHRIIKGTSFWYFWNYGYISDAQKVAAALRRRGYSATTIPEVRNGHVMYEVYYRDWGTGKKPKPDWRKKTKGMVAPAPRARGKR